jgi:ribosome-associated protein
LRLSDQRINNDGIVVIKAQHRSQEKSKEAALARLQDLILSASITPKARKATKPSHGSQLKRLESKNTRGKIKALRGKIVD